MYLIVVHLRQYGHQGNIYYESCRLKTGWRMMSIQPQSKAFIANLHWCEPKWNGIEKFAGKSFFVTGWTVKQIHKFSQSRGQRQTWCVITKRWTRLIPIMGTFFDFLCAWCWKYKSYKCISIAIISWPLSRWCRISVRVSLFGISFELLLQRDKAEHHSPSYLVQE